MYQQTEMETKWPPFCRWHFEMHFLEQKVLNFKWHLIEIYSLRSNWQYVSIGSDNGSVQNRQQFFVWSNADPVLCRHMASTGHNEYRIIAKHFKHNMLAYCNKILEKQPVIIHVILKSWKSMPKYWEENNKWHTREYHKTLNDCGSFWLNMITTMT